MAPPDAASTAHLPNSLLLLVHLHLLEYPSSNRPEYDHNIFNPRSRGIRERSKTMEDITYFLLGKLEGRSLKTILATYPCNQPSESLAFRTTVTKYLENLRYQCIYPSSTRGLASSTTTSKTKMLSDPSDNPEFAWWWKDVIVRKSLLEECAGDKFERLMVSLSTHTLMRLSQGQNQNRMSELLRAQPAVYSNTLRTYQTKRHAWEKSVSILTNTQRDLRTLRDRIKAQGVAVTSKYDGIKTDRLKAMADAQLQELLHKDWRGEVGNAALHFVLELVAIKLATSPPDSAHLPTDTSNAPSVTPSPLPIAAAHHPAHLKRFRRPIFAAKKKSVANANDTQASPLPSHAEIVIAEHLSAYARAHQALKDALSSQSKIMIGLKGKLDTIPGAQSKGIRAFTSSLTLWRHSSVLTTPIDFTPKVGRSFMSSSGFEAEFVSLEQDNMDEDALEKRIEQIRQTILPAYQTVADPSTSRFPPRDLQPVAPSKSNLRSQTLPLTGVQNPKMVPTSKLPVSTLPVPPAISPAKSSRSIRRKSVRFSMAQNRTGRVSMFRVFSGEVNDEVDKLLDETHDFPTDDESTDDAWTSPFKTPRGKGKQRVNRIWTAGTPASAKRNATPRQPPDFAQLFGGEPMQRLPSLTPSASSASSFKMNENDAYSDVGDSPTDVHTTPRPTQTTLPQWSSSERLSIGAYEEEDDAIDNEAADEDSFDDDPPSMTLKEILLSAGDTSYFDLLEVGVDDADGEALTTDSSFVWE